MRFKFSLKSQQLFLVLYGSVLPGWSAGVTLVFCWYFGMFYGCSVVPPLFQGVPLLSAGVPCSVVPYSGVPGFIVYRSICRKTEVMVSSSLPDFH